jgi:hypothetical protein
MSTAILNSFDSLETFANAACKILGIAQEGICKVGVTVTRKIKPHTIWIAHILPNGWKTSTFVSRARFSGFHLEDAGESILLTDLATGMRHSIHLKTRLEWDKPIADNLSCDCPEHKYGQHICKHIAHAVTTELGMKLADRLENLQTEHKQRLKDLQRQQQEREERRRESQERQQTWVQKKFHLKSGYKPAPGFWLEESAGEGEENFKVMCQVESWGSISTQCIGTISSDGEWFTFYNRRRDFGNRILTPQNLALACKDLFNASPHSYKTLCFDSETELEQEFME